MVLLLIIDNYDSFVYNIVDLAARAGARGIVLRNDEVTVRGVERINPDGIIISPGPGNPENPRDVGVSRDVVRELGDRIPVMGICLGHQVIGSVYGARIRRARRIMHGKQSPIQHNGDKIFNGVPRTFHAMRYHSLVIDNPPEDLEVIAWSLDDGEVMGVRHRRHPVVGLQFHPESIGTLEGLTIMGNFLAHYLGRSVAVGYA